jgi:hypothetical protein
MLFPSSRVRALFCLLYLYAIRGCLALWWFYSLSLTLYSTVSCYVLSPDTHSLEVQNPEFQEFCVFFIFGSWFLVFLRLWLSFACLRTRSLFKYNSTNPIESFSFPFFSILSSFWINLTPIRLPFVKSCSPNKLSIVYLSNKLVLVHCI